MVEEEKSSLALKASHRFGKFVCYLANICVYKQWTAISTRQLHYCFCQKLIAWRLPTQACIKLRQQWLLKKSSAEVFCTVGSHSKESADPSAHFLTQKKIKIFNQIIAKTFFEVSRCHCAILTFLWLIKKGGCTLMQVRKNDIDYFECLIS